MTREEFLGWLESTRLSLGFTGTGDAGIPVHGWRCAIANGIPVRTVYEYFAYGYAGIAAGKECFASKAKVCFALRANHSFQVFAQLIPNASTQKISVLPVYRNIGTTGIPDIQVNLGELRQHFGKISQK